MRFSPPPSPERKIALGLLAGLAVWAVLLGAYFTHALEPYELQTYDQLSRLTLGRFRSPGHAVLVAVDQGSLEAARRDGIPWPWPRQMYAPIVDFCTRAGAQAVVFDIFFTEPSSYGVEDDMILAQAAGASGIVWFPVMLSRDDRPGNPREEGILRKMSAEPAAGVPTESPYHSLIVPIEPLSKAARGFGNVAAVPDPDGIYRRLPLFSDYRGAEVPILGLSLYRSLEGGRGPGATGAATLPLDGEGRLLITYYGGEPDLLRFSAYQVIRSSLALERGETPAVDPDGMKGKIVFIGYTAAGLFDLKSTPVSSVYPGMAIHATLLENLLDGDFRVRIQRIPLFALAGLVAVATGIAVMFLAVAWQFALFAVILFGSTAVVIVAAFQLNLWVDGVLVALNAALAFTAASVLSYAAEGRQRRQIREAFSRYMSDVLVQDLLKHPEKLQLGGEKKILTVFFSDLAGFTSLSEKLAPEEVVTLLNRYLTAMTEVILASGGVIDKYEGDAIMAFWGAPVPQPDHAARACLAALDNQGRLAALREEFEKAGLPPVFARIGLNTGEMIIGNMGSSQRFDFTVIGDNVNLASRLEGAGKEYGTGIIISGETRRQAGEAVEVRELDLLQVKGREQPVRIYELLARKGELDGNRAAIRDLFEEGLRHYRAMRWAEAIESFDRALALAPGDGPSKTYRSRCEEFMRHPPPAGWDGVFRLTVK